MSIHPLEEILHPKSIAVFGASPGGGAGFLSSLLEFGFKGNIYPVNPKYSEVLGIKSYPTLKDIPGPVDYVISVIPASGVLSMLADCAVKGVKCIHLYTGRFSETGRPEEIELEQEVLRQSRKYGIRLIGPNCMGVYYPREGLSFGGGFPKKSGSAGLASQSGNLTMDLVRLASLRGVYFSKGISYGNALDFNESDYLDYFSQDPETKIIMMYVEGVKDGKRFFETLRRVASVKPVVILKGGQGKAGARATSSHTGSLAGSAEIWETAVTQAGAVCADNTDELADVAAALYFLPPIKGTRVGIAGGWGGASVMAADQCEEASLDVIPLPEDIREKIKSKGLQIWDWIGNPVDRSLAGGDNFTTGDMLQMMADHQNFDLLITIIGEPFLREGIPVEELLAQFKPKENRKPLLAVVSDGGQGINGSGDTSRKILDEMRTRLIASGTPVYPTVERAANSARKLVDYYQRRK